MHRAPTISIFCCQDHLPGSYKYRKWYHSPVLRRFFLLQFSCCTLIHLHQSLAGFLIPQMCALSFTSLTSKQAVCSWCVSCFKTHFLGGCGCITSRFCCLCITCLFSVECWLDTSPSWVYPFFSLRLLPCAAVFILIVHALFLKTVLETHPKSSRPDCSLVACLVLKYRFVQSTTADLKWNQSLCFTLLGMISANQYQNRAYHTDVKYVYITIFRFAK